MASHGFLAGPVLFVVVFVAVVAIGAWAFIAHRRRLARELAERLALAPRLGLRFEQDPNEDLIGRFGFLDGMPKGYRNYSRNLFTGVYKGIDVRLFDYTWVTRQKSGKHGSHDVHHHVGVAVALTGEAFHKLTIVPETWGHKLWDAVGGEDIDFESEEFSKRFWVKSDDRKFAYDVCHARTMEFLMASALSKWQVQGGVLATWESRHFKPHEVESVLETIVGFVELLPGYVRTTKIGRRDARPSQAEWKEGWWQSPPAAPSETLSRKR